MYRSASLPNGLQILVVDSDLDCCELLVTLFAQYGIETLIAKSASEALEQIQQAQPDLLISEIFLPGEDGFSLIRKMKALETIYHTQLPALALTTLNGKRERVDALKAGFCRYLLKPLDIDELMATVACLTGQAQEIVANVC